MTLETRTWYPGGPLASCMSCTQNFSTWPSSPSEARSSVHRGNEKTGVPPMAPVPIPPPPMGHPVPRMEREATVGRLGSSETGISCADAAERRNARKGYIMMASANS